MDVGQNPVPPVNIKVDGHPLYLMISRFWPIPIYIPIVSKASPVLPATHRNSAASPVTTSSASTCGGGFTGSQGVQRSFAEKEMVWNWGNSILMIT
jgi:hypothetical protein